MASREQQLPLSEQFLEFAGVSGIEARDVSSVREGRIEIRGVRLRYLDWTGAAAEVASRPVVFLHGGALTCRTWDLVCLALRDRFRCIAFDLRGHGDSEWSELGRYGLADYADDTAAVISALELDGPVLVGMSLGGHVALLCAGGRVELRGLVLVDVGPDPPRAGAEQILRAIQHPERFPTFEHAIARARLLNPRRSVAALQESVIHNLRPLPDGAWTWKYDWRAFAAMTPEVREERARVLWSAVEAVRCPVRLVRGGESEILPVEQAERVCAALPDADWREVPGAGHTVQGDNPAGLVHELVPFLDRCL